MTGAVARCITSNDQRLRGLTKQNLKTIGQNSGKTPSLLPSLKLIHGLVFHRCFAPDSGGTIGPLTSVSSQRPSLQSSPETSQ
jgi:predicted ATPase